MPISRNKPCHCGSGKIYKHCCLEKDAKVQILRTPESMPEVPQNGFLYREGFQCLKLGISQTDDLVAVRLGDVIAHLTTKPQKVTVLVGKLEITNKYIANTAAVKQVNIEFNGSTYLLLNYIDKTAEGAVSQGREKFEVILSYLEVALGERLVYDKIFEQTIDLEKKTPVWLSGVSLNPGHFELKEVEDNSLEIVAKQWDFLAGLDNPKQNRIGVALRWYHKGLLDKKPDDIFLSFWIAFEVLTMGGSTNLEAGVDILKEELSSQRTRQELKESLRLGNLFYLRGQILHEGRRVFSSQFDENILLLKNIVSELIRKSVGLAPTDVLAGKI